MCFNTQPPEGGCGHKGDWVTGEPKVSTHSHPKVAATTDNGTVTQNIVSTHSHPKVAAKVIFVVTISPRGFNTQPPEGGCSPHKKARKISRLNTVFR